MRTGVADIARRYRDMYPDFPTLKLARIMYAEEKLLFNSVEHARDHLRYIEGKKGKNTDKKNLGKYRMEADRPRNPYAIPDSDETSYEPFILNAKRVLILSDIHAPYHSIDALTLAIDFAVKEKPDAVFINGDLFDFFILSRFDKDPKKKNFAQELKIGSEIINILHRYLKAPVYFKLGNHDERLEHFFWTKAKELAGVEDFELANLLKSRCDNITVIKDKRVVKLGDLNAVHGHEMGGSVFSPVNISRGLYLRAKASSICGHHHRTSEHTEQDINGKIVTTWSTGCLCELHPAYLPINNWNLGFGICDIDGADFHVRNYRIHKGKIL